jgi:CheY-like chemotaxis protein
LIVDDDPRVRELAEFAAKTAGVFSTVEVASDGASALERLRARDGDLPDAILTDLSMPRVDGLDLVRELQRDPRTRKIPVVMFSSSNLPNDHERALAAGCRAFFVKPPSLHGLTNLLRSVRGILDESHHA